MRSTGADTATRARSVARMLSGVAVVAALAVIAVSGMSTTSARIAASTESNGFLATATVDVQQAASSTRLFFDADNLYPGVTTIGCVAIDYNGSVGADLRVTAAPTGGTGLDEFIDIRLTTRFDGSCPTAASPDGDGGGRLLFDGRLSTFWRTHDSFATGAPVATMTAGDTVAIDAVITMVDDNDAAGRHVELSFSFESRPT
ncbi:MAG: hypothetical protein AB8G14_08070 [Ilumatobacter sp.]